MGAAYQELCDYLAIDAKKCPLNEFFTDLKSFCNLFLTCLQENRLWREQDDKAKRALMSKQLAEDVRKKPRPEAKQERTAFFKPSKSICSYLLSERIITGRCLIDDEDTDVVSNLMSVLRDANVTSQPRRVRRPPGESRVLYRR